MVSLRGERMHNYYNGKKISKKAFAFIVDICNVNGENHIR